MESIKWCIAIHRIRTISSSIRHRHAYFYAELKMLLDFIDDEDVLVAYTAKEELHQIVIHDRIMETRYVNDIIKAFILPSAAAWKREASGFRFQLLRQLIKARIGEESMEGSSSDDEGQVECIVKHPCLQAMLKNLLLVGGMMRNVFMTTDRAEARVELATTSAPYTVQYEALVFLSDVIKRLHGLKIAASYQVELSEHMVMFMDNVFVAMDYVAQPTFVSCAVLGLLGNFQELLMFWVRQTEDSGYSCSNDTMLSKWLERCVVWLLESSCTSAALRLLNDHATVTSQMAFIAKSGPYPFLQQWLLYLSRMGTAYLENLINTRPSDTLQKPTFTSGLQCSTNILSRQQLFAVLAEQDDVLIEVVNRLMQITTIAGCFSFSLDTQLFPSLIPYVTAEFDPDLLFADLVETLGQDHLVLLDLLVSNETQMLEYFVKYLRRIHSHWDTSKQKLQTYGRLEDVMSVLIRLRLEIDRLVAADLFPYNARPLVRRMMAIEELYEESDDDAGQS
ncbi:unnamed protein product [Peronospora belbahrii]|uniref:Protein Lines N-terminal domain-containing protein n=1 Tax=Peronospora belbahrii TaxID=622444 RepID=A0AAU9L7G3_9STRA|nr:unnamed protein product [Peronospora belbahrii]CAH0519169.1 unnamed protein product [Peronospora belbahrii]